MDRSERKALWLAIAAGSLFIVTLAVAHPPTERKHKREHTSLKPPVPTKHYERESALVGPNDVHRDVPEEFRNFDFKNHRYGVYKFPNGAETDLTLYNSELGLPDDLGWFSLKNVYYTDVTGDGRPEAIVELSHVKCDSCYDGATLLYIFTLRSGKLQKIWQYETGSYAYGCGFKSLALQNKQVVLELFGRCPDGAKEYRGSKEYMIEDLTFAVFVFDGGRFVTKTIEFMPEPAQDLKYYEPEVLIY